MVLVERPNPHPTNKARGRKTQEKSMAIKRAWKVYGQDGHRQRESFSPSYSWDLTGKNDAFPGTRVITVWNSDMTGTNDYSVVIITRDTAEQCYSELMGQITDGIFENSRTGRIEEMEVI